MCGEPQPKVVKFHHLDLVVKFGDQSRLRLEEALAMRAIRRMFPGNEVPVPEVFGWKAHQGQNFIYMSLIRGPTMRDAWPSLTESDKTSICDQLGGIVAALRRLHQAPSDSFIGM
jgi:aminoglycoside phosphotransferase